MNYSSIYYCLNGKQKSAYGFCWQWVQDINPKPDLI